MKPSPLSDDDCRLFRLGQTWYGYVPITKVSSTYLRRALPAQEFNVHTWQWCNSSDPVPSPDQIHWLAVLRDPVARWASGVLEFWCRAHTDHQWEPDQCQNWLLEQIEFDIHTRPQVDFLHCIDPDRTTWLWMDSAVEHNSWFADNNIDLNPVTAEDRNQGWHRPQIYFGPQGQRSETPVPGWPGSVPAQQIQAAVKYTLDHNPQARDLIKNYYQADYDLINSVTFYQS